QASEQGEPAPITSADVLAGKVPATTGLTRRELRALAQEQESADIPVVTPEPEVAPKAEKEPEPEVEQTLALRPVVRPQGAQAGEYSVQYEDIRTGHTRQIPVQQPTPVEPPQRKSIFEAQVDTSFEDDLPEEDSSISDTSAAGLPVFDESYEPEEIPVTDPPPAPVEKLQESEEVESSPPSVPRPGDDTYNFPDWHTLTDIPAIAPR